MQKKRAPFGTLNLCTHRAAGQTDDLRNLLFELVVQICRGLQLAFLLYHAFERLSIWKVKIITSDLISERIL